MKNVKSSFTKTALATQSRPPFVVGILPDLLTVMADLGSPWRKPVKKRWMVDWWTLEALKLRVSGKVGRPWFL
jgi:hypothetical protein